MSNEHRTQLARAFVRDCMVEAALEVDAEDGRFDRAATTARADTVNALLAAGVNLRPADTEWTARITLRCLERMFHAIRPPAGNNNEDND